MRQINKSPWYDPKSLVPLVGFEALPHGFEFQLNMYKFGGIRCHAIMSVACLVECMHEIGVGLCPLLVHEAIYEQAHFNQVQLPWMKDEDFLQVLEVFSKHRVEWVHFDEGRVS